MTSEWMEVSVSDVTIQVTKGTTPTTIGFGFENEGVRFIKVESLSEDGRFLEGKFAYISDEAHNSLLRSQLQEDDVLFTIAGTIGRTAIVDAKYLPANTNQAVAIVRPDKAKVSPRFLRYVLSNRAFTVSAKSKTVQSVQANYSLGELKKARFYLPTLEGQSEILSVLSPIDDRITLLRETNSTLEAIAQALFKSWFVDFDPVRAKAEGRMPEGIDAATAALFPDAFEETKLGMVPKGWSAATLSTVATFQNGYAFKGSDWTEVGHPVVKIGNVKPLHIDFDGCSFVSPQTVAGLERFKLGAGDLLVGMTGYVGETGLVPQNDTASYLNQRVGRISTNNGLQDLGFVFSAVRQKEFKIYAESQSHGSAQANVSGADLMKFPVTVPSADILEKYNDLTHQFIASILNNHSVATSLTSLRDTLLPRLISGQLRIADAEAELEKATA
jgi:type I restriction enzyme S subunit